MSRTRSAHVTWAIAAVLVAAAGLRLWRLDGVPPGLQFDEAYNALDAARVLAGARDLFFTANGGREPLNVYVQALALGVLGRDHTLLAIRLGSAAAGVITVALLYGFTSDVFRDRRLGTLSAAYLAVSYWHLHFSRYGIRAVFAPLWTVAAVWLWWQAVGTPRAAAAGPPREASAAGLGPGVAPGSSPRTPRPDHPTISARGAGRAALACGLCLAAAVYSHPTGRLVPLILVAHALYRGWSDRPAAPALARGLATAAAAALAAFLPLGLWFARHPGAFVAHPSDVSIAAVAARDHGGSLAAALAHQLAAVLAMPLWAGDPSTFHNLTTRLPDGTTVGLPVFDPLSALMAVLGIGIALAALTGGDADRRDRAALLAAWLGVMLIPTVLSDRPPNYSRAIAALPVIVLLPALGLRWSIAALDVRWSRPAGRRRHRDGGPRGLAGAGMVAPDGSRPTPDPILDDVPGARALGLSAAMRLGLAAGALAVAGVWTAYHYFVVFATRSPHVYTSYDVDKQDAYAALAVLAPDADVFLHPVWAEHATIAYLNAGGPVRALDATTGLVLPAGSRDVVVAFPAREADRRGWDAAFADRFGAAAERSGVPDAFGEPLLTTFRIKSAARGDMRPPTDAPLEPATWVGARFGGVIELAGYTLGAARAGAPLPVTLVWRSLAPTAGNWTTFVHVVGSNGAAWGQLDREPVATSYRTSGWRVGDVVIDRFEPVLTPDAAGPAMVDVGWYDLATGARLPVGNGTSVRLGPVAIRRE